MFDLEIMLTGGRVVHQFEVGLLEKFRVASEGPELGSLQIFYDGIFPDVMITSK